MTGPPDVGHDDHEHHHDDSSAIAQSLRRPEVFAVLYDRYAADVHKYVMRRLGDAAADDLTADTFLVAFRARSRYDLTRTNARPWFFGIAANLISKQRRTEERALRALARTGHDPVTESWVDHADDRIAGQACPGRPPLGRQLVHQADPPPGGAAPRSEDLRVPG
ncbi:RNA polymerase sigma factor [Streptomyces asoensis]|uniref:RNA polymerase sigma factor n=1 Tax=Streptomyces sp. MBT49 TaxID=1488380 RepID=UPI0035AB79FC